jgi:hypothetical protein
MKKEHFKIMIKTKIRRLAFNDLENLKKGHSKVNAIIYKKFEPQKYITSGTFNNDQIYLLFKLRTRMVDVKRNFKNLYNNEMSCRLCDKEEETQMHLLKCEIIALNCPEVNELVKYQDLFSDNVIKQHKATKLFQTILDSWSKMIT